MPKAPRNLVPPPPSPGDAQRFGLRGPRLDQLADDAWQLAQRAPALPADPALVATAAALLADLRRLLRHEPGLHLLPNLAPAGPIALHALALALRQAQAALAGYAARQQPPVRTVSGEIDAINRLMALYLRDMTHRVLAHQRIPLPPDLRRPADLDRPPPPPPPPGKPPARKPHILRIITHRRNIARRKSKAGQ